MKAFTISQVKLKKTETRDYSAPKLKGMTHDGALLTNKPTWKVSPPIMTEFLCPSILNIGIMSLDRPEQPQQHFFPLQIQSLWN